MGWGVPTAEGVVEIKYEKIRDGKRYLCAVDDRLFVQTIDGEWVDSGLTESPETAVGDVPDEEPLL